MNFRNLGITDEVNECSCCGKQNLKCTVAFEIEETGDIVYYGRTCASRNTGKPPKIVLSEAKIAYKARVLEAQKIFKESIESRVYETIIRKLNENRLEGEPGWLKIRLSVIKPVSEACWEVKQRLIKEFKVDYL